MTISPQGNQKPPGQNASFDQFRSEVQYKRKNLVYGGNLKSEKTSCVKFTRFIAR
jgi:hypothetical protein